MTIVDMHVVNKKTNIFLISESLKYRFY